MKIMEKILLLMIALSLVTSATAAEKAATPTPVAAQAATMDCSKITDKTAKKDCENQSKQEAPATNTAPMTK